LHGNRVLGAIAQALDRNAGQCLRNDADPAWAALCKRLSVSGRVLLERGGWHGRPNPANMCAGAETGGSIKRLPCFQKMEGACRRAAGEQRRRGPPWLPAHALITVRPSAVLRDVVVCESGMGSFCLGCGLFASEGGRAQEQVRPSVGWRDALPRGMTRLLRRCTLTGPRASTAKKRRRPCRHDSAVSQGRGRRGDSSGGMEVNH
jgi:hypothetical protein